MSTLHGIELNGHKIGLRDVIQVVVTLIACVGLYFSITAKTSKNTSDITLGDVDRIKLWTTITYMNEHGTNHSHETDEKQQQTIDRLSKQFDDLNTEMRNLSPKVDKIDTNVLWLMGKYMEHK